MILITGGTGFVGRHVVRSLSGRGIAMRILLRDPARIAENDEFSADFKIVGDVFSLSEQKWCELLEGVDTVIHLAWYAEPGQYLESPINLECLRGTIELARACAHLKVRRFVGIGSCSEYAPTNTNLHSSSRLEPTTLYASCKVSAYHVLRQLFRASDTQFAWCRLFYIYGEGEDRRRLVPYIRSQIERNLPVDLTTGAQVKDFMDVEEAASIVAEVALREFSGPFNVCSGIPISIRNLALRIAGEYGRVDLLRFGAREDGEFDPPRIVGVPDWVDAR